MNCLICGSEKSQVIMTINHKCLDCGHIFIEGPDDLEKYYNEEYREKSPLPNEDVRKKFTNSILDKVKKVIDLSNKTILEAGAADGFMSDLMYKRFGLDKSNFWCCELDSKLAKKCLDRGFNIFEMDLLKVTKQFDILFAIDILEHIEDIQAVKEFIKKYFRYAVIQLPRSRGPKTSFKAHFQTFSDRSLEIWLEGFKVIGSWNNGQMDTCFGNSYLRVIENVDKTNHI